MHMHQPRDVFVTSWFIFIPLALCFFIFLYQHTVDSADFEFGDIFFYLVYTFDFLLCIFISVIVYFHLCV
jgi:hypothetical protein